MGKSPWSIFYYFLARMTLPAFAAIESVPARYEMDALKSHQTGTKKAES
jgi:hypothetical protein